MADAPLARLALPGRVPYGFHAMWVGSGAFNDQLRQAAVAAAAV
jgi:hypothetical protein